MTLIKFKAFLSQGALLQLSPDSFNLVLGPFETLAAIPSQIPTGKTLIFQPHFWDFLETNTSENSFVIGNESFLLSRVQLAALLSELSSDLPSKSHDEKRSPVWQTPTEPAFQTQFKWSQQKFADDLLQKTVPIISQKAEFNFQISDLVSSLKNLIEQNNYGWTYGLWQNQNGFLGHTPEQICRWKKQDQKINTTALAGTFPKSTNAADEILKDEKNLEEHRIVVDDIESKLQKLNFIKSLKHGKTEALELKYLVHLKTEFQANAQNLIEAFQVVQALHPTAALGLFPPVAKEYGAFKELQIGMNRKNFAAPFAMMSSDFLFCIAAIRSFFFTNHEIEIFSGCGVTAKSIYENELTELNNKRESVKKMMGFNS